MAVVSVRIEDDVLAVLKAHNVNVSEVARAALGDQARRLRALEALGRLRRLKLPVHGPSTVEVLRELRDGGDVRP